MINLSKTIIDKKLVHKDYDKNVFISNLRRKLPNFIKESLFKNILKKLDIGEKQILLDNYKIISSDNFNFLNNKETNFYKLNSILTNFDVQEYVKIEEQKKEFIDELYKFNKKTNSYLLTKDVSEEEEKKILEILNKKSNFIQDEIKVLISNIFDKFPETGQSNIVYANMHVNLKHDFFFEHKNDHVPGLMIIETFRQFGVALCHIYGKVPEKDAQMCLDCLDSNFYNYAELSLPITLKGIIKETQWNKIGYWSFFDFETFVFQNNKEIGFFRLQAQMIPTKVFKRIRRKTLKTIVEPYRFIPFPDFSNHFALKNIETNKYTEVELENISNTGFMVKSPNFIENEIKKEPYNFYLYLNNIGFINGKCEKRWQNQNNGEAGFEITEIINDDDNNLKNFILNYCYIYEKRELY